MSKKIKRRDFLKGATTGVGFGLLGAMGLYSYSPGRNRHFAEVARKMTDIGVCKSVTVTNISETSWFENAVLMGDIKGAGGLLVNQYELYFFRKQLLSVAQANMESAELNMQIATEK